MKKICPSILSADFSSLARDIKKVELGGADILHCDIMDGNFVPNISFGPLIVKKLNEITDLPLDVHLMINNPSYYVDVFSDSGADFISVHFENNIHLNRVINKIKSKKIKAGVAINPATSLHSIEYILEYVDFVLIMSVNPGFGGQSFINNCLRKISELKNNLLKINPDCLIEVDGGINSENIKSIADAGADMLVCGSSVFSTADIEQEVRKLKKLIS